MSYRFECDRCKNVFYSYQLTFCRFDCPGYIVFSGQCCSKCRSEMYSLKLAYERFLYYDSFRPDTGYTLKHFDCRMMDIGFAMSNKRVSSSSGKIGAPYPKISNCVDCGASGACNVSLYLDGRYEHRCKLCYRLFVKTYGVTFKGGVDKC